MKNTKNVKGRVWTFVVYLDDISIDTVKKLLNDYKVPCAISPLHSADEDVTLSHYHILMYFPGNKTAQSLYEELGTLRKKGNYLMFQKVSSISAMCRYLIHKDNPDKEQFSGDYKKLITCLNGFNIQKYFSNDTDELIELSELIDYCLENKPDFEKLVRYVREEKNELLSTLAKKSPMLFQLCRHNKPQSEKKVDISKIVLETLGC